jgi:heme-degrading monooxygenase HmoA
MSSSPGCTSSAIRANRHDGQMIVEHALLAVKPGQEDDFEVAFTQAQSIIAGRRGFGRLSLSRGIERPGTYLLLVEWDRLEDHTKGFRGSPEYTEWRSLLHHFYEPFPTVEHYRPVHRIDPTYRSGGG